MPAASSHDNELTGIDPDFETDAGPLRAGRGSHERDGIVPKRRCVATMESRPQSEMIRFALSPSGEVTPDLAARLPGRGAWVLASRSALELAVKKGAFARAFKGGAKASPDLPGQVEALLTKRALDQLGLVKRSGDLILGFEQVREAIRSARPACLIEASDGAEDGRQKLMALLLAAHGPSRNPASAQNDERRENQGLPPIIGCFSADELGMALGRERVIHACLKQGRFAQSWIGELVKLSGFRRVWLSFDEGPSQGSSPNDDTGRNIDDTQARARGGDPPAARAATDVSE